MTLPITYQGLSVNENPTNPEDYCCCPVCGSLGVFHFTDSDDGTDQQQHTCFRCDATFQGCMVSPSKTRGERLNNCQIRGM